MSHHVPSGDSFAELMAAQLERAPWLALSIALHAILLLLIALIPVDRSAPPQEVEITLQPAEPPPEVVEPPQPPDEPVEPERPIEDVPLVDEPVDVAPVESDVVADVDEFTPTAFEGPSDNPAIGLAGNAGPKYAGRPSGGGGGGGPRNRPNDATTRALEWLARHQDDDGRWDADEFMKHDLDGEPCDGAGNPTHDAGVTGLALLAFLGDGHTLRSGDHREVVRDAVRWLREQQDGETGLIGTTASNEFVYDHAIATLALVEACGLSRSRVLRPTVERALAYLAYHRTPYGGWRYQPRDGDCDTSVTGWCVLALEAADDFGFAVDEAALQCADAWFEQVTDPTTGRTGYTERGGLSSRRVGDHASRFPRDSGECMTAVSLLCRVFRGGIERRDPLVETQAKLVAAKPPRWDPEAGTIDHYAWYYASYALYQIGGPTWKAWSRATHEAVCATQRADGNARGSWDPIGVWGDEGGRVYSTAILCLTMQAHYRYARVLVR